MNTVSNPIAQERSMLFEEYLNQKKIDARRFAQHEPERYADWKREFLQMHPDSFTAQKKFLINDTRRQYLLTQPTI